MLAESLAENAATSTSAPPESLIDAWTAEQLRYVSLAIFEDSGLSFSISGSPAIDTDDYAHPITRTIIGSISGLHCVGGLDISFPRHLKDEGVATLTVLEYPSLKVRSAGKKEVQASADRILPRSFCILSARTSP